jgi:hypothetical protein
MALCPAKAAERRVETIDMCIGIILGVRRRGPIESLDLSIIKFQFSLYPVNGKNID